MSTERMDAGSAAYAREYAPRLAEPSLRVAINRPGAARSYASKGLTAVSSRYLDKRRAERAIESSKEPQRDKRRVAGNKVWRAKAARSAEIDSLAAAGADEPRHGAAAEEKLGNRRAPLSESMLRNALGKIDEYVRAIYHHLEYDYHERSGEYFVKVVDDETDEVIREIPPEKLLDIYSSIMEMVGLFYDERR